MTCTGLSAATRLPVRSPLTVNSCSTSPMFRLTVEGTPIENGGVAVPIGTFARDVIDTEVLSRVAVIAIRLGKFADGHQGNVATM